MFSLFRILALPRKLVFRQFLEFSIISVNMITDLDAAEEQNKRLTEEAYRLNALNR